MLFSANELPGTSDHTHGFFDRWIIVPFTRDFRGRADPGTENKLHTELEGVLACAVSALRALDQRGHFTLPASVKAATEAYRTETDPDRALDTFLEGLAYTREHRLLYFEALIVRDAAGLEAVHGDIDHALDLFTSSLNSLHQAGNTTSLVVTFATLAVFFDRTKQPEIAATIYGTTTHHTETNQALGLAPALDHLRHTLDAETFDDCVRTGAAMNITEAVHYANHHINTTRQHQT
jgi:hypothetical protein